jgi:NAD(P)-dependent dehydrogenase (short-subunit alcohol dehydrogenase family)
MDLSSLRAVKEGVAQGFKHGRLDILMNNAGIICKPPILSADGYEIQFATNHLGHAMLTKQLLPVLLKTAKEPGSDVRVVTLSSEGYMFHRAIKGGISFSELDAGSGMSRFMGGWIRYGQSKLANILFASELARHHPELTSVSVHPGFVMTPMNTEMVGWNKVFGSTSAWLTGEPKLQPDQGVLSQLWCAGSAKKGELKNGGFYKPVGVESSEKLTAEGKDEALAKKLWDWTEKVLGEF